MGGGGARVWGCGHLDIQVQGRVAGFGVRLG